MDSLGQGNMGNMGNIQAMGIVNAMKTGNIILDMAIAMGLPVVISLLFTFVTKIQTQLSQVDWSKFFGRNNHIYERFINHSTLTSTARGTSMDLGGDSQNEVLIKAIQLFLDFHGLFKLKSANLELKSFGEDKSNDYDDYYYYDDNDSKSDSFADTLSKYRVVKKPITGQWISLGAFESEKGGEYYEVELIVKEDEENINDGNSHGSTVAQKNVITLHFKSEGKNSIDSFIEKAYKWYLDELRKLEDESRYMYEITMETNNGYEESAKQKYKRYRLSDEKTFESLFFRQKDTVLGIVNHFKNKTGKYAIRGYPHKLGLLLHGPPGTGKTSMIKALAEHTGRSIVNVPLSRISTNAELASIFFDQKYYIDGEQVPVTLGFKDVIFVMEDIDAVSKVVRRRDGKKTAAVTFTEQVDMPITKSLWNMILESNDDNCKELASLLIEKSERLKKAAHAPEILSSAARRMGTVPGLSLVGEDTDNDTAAKIAKEAVETAQKLMDKYSTVDQFIGTHAKSLKQMIDAGATVSEEFENELLGLSVHSDSGPGSFISLRPPSLSREVSVSQDFGGKDDALIETSDKINFDEMSLLIKGFNEDRTSQSQSGAISPGKKEESQFEGIGPTTNFYKSKKDELNLTGILNVLDGVVDTPGRMLVITTNHPEVLDPALIRPGRIDKKLMLGYMATEDVVQMIEHYFQTHLNEEQKLRLKTSINGDSSKPLLKMTPAQVEQMASEFDDVEEMIAVVESKSSATPKRKNNRTQIVYNT